MKDTKPQIQKLSDPNTDESGPSYHVSQRYLYRQVPQAPPVFVCSFIPGVGTVVSFRMESFPLSLLHTFCQLTLRAGRCVTVAVYD